MTLLDTARAFARLRRERDQWRDEAQAHQHAADEATQLNVALRRRLDVLEKRPGITAANVKLAHELERAELALADVQERYEIACRLVARYALRFGDLPAEVEA